MINLQMRDYDYYTYGSEDGYGQPTISNVPSGKVSMAINLITQNLADNALYREATYLGLTHTNLSPNTVVDFCGEHLKVLYSNRFGRYNQIWMARQ